MSNYTPPPSKWDDRFDKYGHHAIAVLFFAVFVLGFIGGYVTGTSL